MTGLLNLMLTSVIPWATARKALRPRCLCMSPHHYEPASLAARGRG
jgi:hypothetical protein